MKSTKSGYILKLDYPPGTAAKSLHEFEFHSSITVLIIKSSCRAFNSKCRVHLLPEFTEAEHGIPLFFNAFKGQGVWAKAGCGICVGEVVGEVEFVRGARGVIQGEGAEGEVEEVAEKD